MKNRIMFFLTMTLAALPFIASAQKSSDPEGFLTYSLPSTTVVVEVEAVQEKFFAGPYARYAEKYLGIKARQKDETTYQLTEINLKPLVEADQNRRYSIPVKKSVVDATFLKLSSQGLISMADGTFGDATVWRFPKSGKGDFAERGVSSNLKSEAATLYRNKKDESAYNRIAVQQNMVVEKTLEQKAAEAAEMIVRLREQRLQIVTGDTDATYSGEAMGAAIEEMTRLEKEYMSLFVGYSDFQNQKMSFDITPSPERESQMYVAFRISDTSGLVPADNLSGKPVVMEIIPQNVADPQVKEEVKSKAQLVHFLIPAICTVRIKDGSDILIQSRMPIYQLGREGSMPVNTTLK